jgi:hypothetical protein
MLSVRLDEVDKMVVPKTFGYVSVDLRVPQLYIAPIGS